jgi:YesN/AraC family two-component response regulator
MADMNGTDLAKALREIRPDIPIILMSGYVSPLFAARARNIGVAEVLSKPLVARDIARSLAGVL